MVIYNDSENSPASLPLLYCACANELVVVMSGVHNAKAEECTTPYMRQNIEINIGVGGSHGNQGY